MPARDDIAQDKIVQQVTFELPQEDGWPPVAQESVLAEPVGDQRLALTSIPYFVRYLSLGDVVFAEKSPDGSWRGLGLCERSGHSAVRVLPHSDAVRETVSAWLEERGCTTQYHDEWGLVAVDIPNGVANDDVLDYLFAMLDEGVLEFETGWMGE